MNNKETKGIRVVLTILPDHEKLKGEEVSLAGMMEKIQNVLQKYVVEDGLRPTTLKVEHGSNVFEVEETPFVINKSAGSERNYWV